MLDAIIKETAEKVSAAIIWMHGLGADGYDFADIIPELGLPQNAAIRFIFPHAPVMPVSVNGGYKMRAWYDIKFMDDGVSLDLENKPDVKSIEESSKLIAELIDAEIEKGISPEKIILIGFSQGGVIALHTATRYPKKLAGAANLSSNFPTANTMPLDGVNAKLPVFFAHGNLDNVVPAALSEKAFEFLKANGNVVERHTYNMQHSVCLEELKTLGAWIAKLLVN
ncbi:MAG: dienelactone hydrolase family protein [Fibromonadaceae bacterium]|jgi:phospholipase/carboxylesterase|nr:dienelactone hydrolase family protein [Fibromonadaceae bacterium]